MPSAVSSTHLYLNYVLILILVDFLILTFRSKLFSTFTDMFTIFLSSQIEVAEVMDMEEARFTDGGNVGIKGKPIVQSHPPQSFNIISDLNTDASSVDRTV